MTAACRRCSEIDQVRRIPSASGMVFSSCAYRLTAHLGAYLVVHHSAKSPLGPQLVACMVHKQQHVVLGVDQVAYGLQNDTDKLIQAATPSTDAPKGFIQLGQPLLLCPENNMQQVSQYTLRPGQGFSESDHAKLFTA